jgi:hypothetical protein
MSQQTPRITVGQKILIIATSFSLPIAVLVYFVTSTIQSNYRFTELECMGNRYQRPLEQILEGLQAHQIATSYGGGKDAAKIEAYANDVDTAFQELAKIDRAVGTDLQFTDEGLGKRGREHVRVATVDAEWKELAESVRKGRPVAETQELYAHLVADVRTMITHAGDTSNLILDPDLDSYYMMDCTLLALPQTQERIARISRYGLDQIAAGRVDSAARVQLSVHAAQLRESDLDRIVASTNTALTEDENFYGVCESFQKSVPPLLADYQNATNEFVQAIERLASAEQPAISAAAFLAAGQKAQAASFRYWDVADRELDRLLDTRLAKYEGDRTWALALSGLALLIATALSYAVARSITLPLKGLVSSLGPGANLLRGCVNQIADSSTKESTSPEETAIICGELNGHADDMIKAVNQLVGLVEGLKAAENQSLEYEAAGAQRAA